ncbi:hypothetical protein ES703_68352 [subsurface metagenome]
MNRPLSNRKLLIGNDQLRVYLQLNPQPGAGRTGTVRAIKTKCSGSNLTQANSTLDAGKVLREQ